MFVKIIGALGARAPSALLGSASVSSCLQRSRTDKADLLGSQAQNQ